MITVTETFDDPAEAREAVAWRDAYAVVDWMLNRLREVYKYEEHPGAVRDMAEKLRVELVEECNERQIGLTM